MRRPNFLLPVVALVGLVLFFSFLVRLLLLRYERGDIYPAYSTLRADPLGTRAYYEALDSLDQYPVARGFTSLHRELEKKPATLFYLGFDADDLASFSKEETAQLDTYVKNGGRMVMMFAPEGPGERISDEDKKALLKKIKAEPSKKDAAKPDQNPPKPTPEAPPDQDASGPQTQQEKYEREQFRKEEDSRNDSDQPKEGPPHQYHRSLAALWGFDWDRKHEDEEKEEKAPAADSSSQPDTKKPEVLALSLQPGDMEPSVPWKSALYFVRLEPDWQVLYDAKDKPVLIRRPWGKGEIIMATDSYLISNEALRNNRRSALLGLLSGPPGSLLFDETHLGTQEQEGVMFLAEKFRLEGYLYGMLGVVLLFLWRNSLPLVPPRLSDRHALLGGTVSGKDSRSGLVNLLRRNIPAADILKISLAEWKRSVMPGRRQLQGKMPEMESILSAAEAGRDDKLVQSYHSIREINVPSRAKGNYATKS